MPTADETFEQTCSGAWDPASRAGRVFIENLDTERVLRWAIAGASAPSGTQGFTLPAAHGAKSGAEGIIVPAGKTLWIRGEPGQRVSLTAEQLA